MSVLVDENTRIVIQGITGREASTMSMEMINYGSKVLAGVTPGKEGVKVHGVPVYDCVKDAVKNHQVNASVISVPAAFAKDAIMEALDSGIKVVLVLTERIPRLDALEVVDYANKMGASLIGPNSGGIISVAKTRLGYLGGNVPEKAFSIGPVGIISRSGGMCTEISNLLTMNGIGQSTVISMGGDPIVGSTYIDYLSLFEEDSDTKVVVLFCEPGGQKEESASEFIRKGNFTKPAVAFFGGKFVDNIPGARFGHASVIVRPGSGSTREKSRLFKEVGIHVVENYSDIVTEVKKLI